jgi:thioredoxin-dependent peroxiredoxin
MLNPGTMAPSIEASLHTGEMFHLQDLRNKSHLVLYFYPRDFTFGCTREACSFRDHGEEFKNLGAVVLGVSSDSPESHQRFARQHKLTFGLISDPDHAIAKCYETLILNGLLPLRVTYVIDKHGIIRGAFHHELLISNHQEHTVQILKGLEKGTL